jgi:hypothetical protein
VSFRLGAFLALAAVITVPASGALAAEPPAQTESAGGIGVRLLSGPQVPAAPFIVERVAPGTTITRRVEISNSTSSTADVAVYTAAASLHRGAFAFGAGHSANELSSWASVGRDVLRMPAGSKTVETLTINVPRDASSGDRYAVLWAEVSAPAPAAGGVMLVNRVGVRMYVAIGPGGSPASSFVIGTLSAKRTAAGRPLVLAMVHNTGGSTLDISGNLTLSRGPGGLSAGPFPVELGAGLAPADSEPMTVRLHKGLPRGPWLAEIRLSSGLLRRRVEATITFPSAAAPPPTSAVTGGSNLRTYAVVGLLSGALVAISALLLSRRGTRRSGWDTGRA